MGSRTLPTEAHYSHPHGKPYLAKQSSSHHGARRGLQQAQAPGLAGHKPQQLGARVQHHHHSPLAQQGAHVSARDGARKPNCSCFTALGIVEGLLEGSERAARVDLAQSLAAHAKQLGVAPLASNRDLQR